MTGERPPAGAAGHYFSEDPSSVSDRRSVDLHLEDFSGRFATDRGVFARDRIDPGTKLLLSEGPPARDCDEHLVDVGAGYGPISVVLAHRNPQATVWAVEPNSRARELCRVNSEIAGLTNVRVISPDEWPDGQRVDRIWSNPPIRIGKPALHGLLTEWLDRLSEHGSAHLVVQKHLGADSLQRWMINQGWATARRQSRAAYRLFDVDPRIQQVTDD